MLTVLGVMLTVLGVMLTVHYHGMCIRKQLEYTATDDNDDDDDGLSLGFTAQSSH